MEQENTSTEKPVDNNAAGDKPQTAEVSKFEDFNAERMEQENQRIESAIIKREELRARLQLGGRADAGKPAKTQEEIDKEIVDEKVRHNLRHAGYIR